MAISIVGYNEATWDVANIANRIITVPGTPQAGDLLVAVGGMEAGAAGSGSGVPAGCTTIAGNYAGPTVPAYIAYRFWQSGDTTIEFNRGSGASSLDCWGGLLLVRPTAGSTIDTPSNGGTTLYTAHGGTLTQTLTISVDELLVVVGNVDEKQSGFDTWLPSDLVERADSSAGSGSPANWFSWGLADGIITASATQASVVAGDTGQDARIVAATISETAPATPVYPPWPRRRPSTVARM